MVSSSPYAHVPSPSTVHLALSVDYGIRYYLLTIHSDVPHTLYSLRSNQVVSQSLLSPQMPTALLFWPGVT